MNQAVHIWVQRASTIPGVLACGVRCADRSIVAQSADERFPIAWVQSAVREIAEIASVLQHDRIATDRLRWRFENGRIHSTAKDDGTVAAVIAMPQIELSPEIDGLLAEFQNLGK